MDTTITFCLLYYWYFLLMRAAGRDPGPFPEPGAGPRGPCNPRRPRSCGVLHRLPTAASDSAEHQSFANLSLYFMCDGGVLEVLSRVSHILTCDAGYYQVLY